MQHVKIEIGKNSKGTDSKEKLIIKNRFAENFQTDNIDVFLSYDKNNMIINDIYGMKKCINGNPYIILGNPIDNKFHEISSEKNIIESFKKFSGVFSVIYYSSKEKILHVITDFLGNFPLYFSNSEKSMEISTLTRALSYDPDPTGWSGFFFAGHIIGSGTLSKDVQRIPGAQHWKISVDDLTIEKQTYWVPPLEIGTTNVSDLIDAFQDNIGRYVNSVSKTSILLSGGVDSRMILGCSVAAGVKPAAHIVNHSEEAADADGVFAERIARACGLELNRHEPEWGFSSSTNYLRYIEAIEGAFPTYNLFIGKVLGFVPEGGVLSGQLPNVALRPLFPVGGYAAYDKAHFQLEGSTNFEAARRLFTPAFFSAMQDGFHTALKDSRTDLPDNDCGIGHWLTINRMQRRAGYNSYKAYESRASVLAAGACQDFWKLSMQMPRHEKADYKLCWQILETRFPELASIPVISGGVLMAAPSGQKALRAWETRNAIFHFLKRHPRLARLVARKIRPTPPSSFLSSPVLFEPDAALQPQTLEVLRASPQSDPAAMRMLFHWKTTGFHHAGTLYSAFGRDPADGIHTQYAS